MFHTQQQTAMFKWSQQLTSEKNVFSLLQSTLIIQRSISAADV